jgi:protein-L-isoaspartate(D-aspartate) O-methyltransferase
VSRDRYVPAAFRDCAYADDEIPLGHGQCMLRPSLAGRVLQALSLTPADRVLEIGTGSGYLTHCLAECAGSVVSIDLYEDFVNGARQRLADAGIDKVEITQMDGSVSLPDGPFDAIAVTAAVRQLDDRYVEALAPGGRMFIVVGESPVMTATLVTRDENGEVTVSHLFETDIPMLVTPTVPPVFSF